MILAVVGAGGKTGLIKKYAEEYRAQGKRVFVTTSTHMFVEPDTLVTDDAEKIIAELEAKGYVMAGTAACGKKTSEPEGAAPKIGALSQETYKKVCEKADVVLIEADGSKHMPIKFPNETEPVIYDNVEEIAVVCGLHALGRKAKEVCHRLELVTECLDISEDTIIEPQHVQRLVREGYLKPLREKYPNAKISVEPNHDNSLYQRAVAALLRADKEVSLLKREWFQRRPKLIICGGGHVSMELAKMAALLEFDIKVIDDREEFAHKERFPQAEEVICASFDHLEEYLEFGAFYCVVTRGHKDDFQCVKKILQKPYTYLGMIGSRLKVQKTFENLRAEGVSEEQINSICAPIGLPIKAVTPAEIAVSILAQMIQVKNETYTASASQQLLDVENHGILCVIIHKTGSSPRGVGSMMFVTEQGTIDSIGGGVVEFSVIKDAGELLKLRRTGTEVMPVTKEYNLNNETSAALGMICGGSNEILFIPV